MPEVRRKFDPEFREGAVWFVTDTGRPVAEVGRELGINEGTLWNWVRQYRTAQIEPGAVTECGPLVRRGDGLAAVTAHIAAQRTDHGIPVAVACRALGVAVSWFYKHWGRPPTATEQRQRRFNPDAPNVAFVGDITGIKTWEGKLYLATVIDLYSTRLLGWAIGEDCRAPLVCDAMKTAIAVRRGDVTGVVMHTDRGSTRRRRSSNCAVVTRSPSRCRGPGRAWTRWPSRSSRRRDQPVAATVAAFRLRGSRSP